MKIKFYCVVLAFFLVVCPTGKTQESKTYGDLHDIKSGDTSHIGHMSHGSSGNSDTSRDARDSSADRRPSNNDVSVSTGAYSSPYYIPGAADSREHAKFYNAEGHKAFKGRDYSEALDDYEAAMLLDPDNDDYKCNRDLALAMLAYRRGYYHQAIKNMRMVINKYHFQEPWVIKRYAEILNRDEGERNGTYEVTKGGDYDCPHRNCEWHEYLYIKPGVISK